MPIPAGSETGAPALATQADVETELGRALSSDEQAKVDGALASASDFVRSEARRKFAAGTYTVRRRARGGIAKLDRADAVTAVRTVDSLGNATDLSGYTLRGSTLYGLGCADWLEVTYTSSGIVPDDLRRVVAAMAARDLTDDRPQGATSYSVTKGPFSESADFEGPTDAVMPTPSEARIIGKYKATSVGSVSLV